INAYANNIGQEQWKKQKDGHHSQSYQQSQVLAYQIEKKFALKMGIIYVYPSRKMRFKLNTPIFYHTALFLRVKESDQSEKTKDMVIDPWAGSLPPSAPMGLMAIDQWIKESYEVPEKQRMICIRADGQAHANKMFKASPEMDFATIKKERFYSNLATTNDTLTDWDKKALALAYKSYMGSEIPTIFEKEKLE
ncbi:MAG: hypothetical protein WCG27_07435, partial [Pseudomonadota bacterium]